MEPTGPWQAIQAATRDAWDLLRRLSGDDAYDRYLEHMRRVHPQGAMLSRRDFERDRQQRKWNRMSRCC